MSNINKLLEKYWEGETTLEEEKNIKKHFSTQSDIDTEADIDLMFSFFEKEKQIKYKGNISIPKVDKSEPKLIKMSLFKRISVAASILVILSIGGYMAKDIESNNNPSYTKNEIKDPEKARRIAEDAIAMLASNYAKGEKTITKSLKSFDKVNIINSLIKSN